MTKVGIRTCAHDPLAAAPRCGVCFKELEEKLADRTSSVIAAAGVMTAVSGENADQKDQLEALTRFVLPSCRLAPTSDGRVLLTRGDGSQTTIPRPAARAAIRCLHFVIPEWLWSEKDPK